MYNPKENELDELGFVWDYKVGLSINGVIGTKLWNWHDPDGEKEYKFFIGGEVEVFPQSIEDVETLIRLFKQP